MKAPVFYTVSGTVARCMPGERLRLVDSPVDSQCEVECLTKRVVLKEVASMYDPLGLISPLDLSGRLIFQETVVRKLDWDAAIPDDLAVGWLTWRRNAQRLQDLRIPRPILPCFPISTPRKFRHRPSGGAIGRQVASHKYRHVSINHSDLDIGQVNQSP